METPNRSLLGNTTANAYLPMLPDPQQLQAYFKRTGFSGSPAPDLVTLQRLHALHPQAIAFENLNSWLGLPVSLQAEHVTDKLVAQGRGGYCFEHNQLFKRVLQTLGYEVHGLSARVLWMVPEDVSLPRTHMALWVNVAGKPYLADVGFGGMTLTAPLELNSRKEQETPHELHRLACEDGLYTLSALVAGHWQPLYCFSLERQLPIDYETANWYVSTHPQSRFVNQLIAGRVDTLGRHALLDKRYTWHQPGHASESIELQNQDELRAVLKERLLINLDGLPALDEKLATLFTART
jgi:N-hydroxyarylamine O-acetyltransferase